MTVFDGIVKSGDKQEALSGVPFDALSIGNIATPSTHNIDNQVWIQSHCGAKSSIPGGIWYELGRPAREYEKHWEAFEWMALLVKYVSDALHLCVERNRKVELNYFRKDFGTEMKLIHGTDPAFQRWMLAFGSGDPARYNLLTLDDFRIPVATHSEFLWSQLQTAAAGNSLKRHLKQPLWGEVLPSDLTAVPYAHPQQKPRERCIVTAYVGSLFDWIFSEGVEIIEPDADLSDDDSIDNMDYLLPKPIVPQPPRYYTFHHQEYQTAVFPRFTTGTTGMVKVGDVVEMGRDEQTQWKMSTQKWYAFVTDRWTTPRGVVKLKILWLYWPEDVALCKSMKYPFSNEVFF